MHPAQTRPASMATSVATPVPGRVKLTSAISGVGAGVGAGGGLADGISVAAVPLPVELAGAGVGTNQFPDVYSQPGTS